VNLGILAHVDAGKTTLTERLLFAAGVIDHLGRVDDGTTQTDSLALERTRGITIKSAVASFVIDDVTVNLIDTPGHPDFIAEVERVLGVLDGAVVVVSAVEGVQSQTLLLFRALRRLGVPTLFFINKIDRAGADEKRVLAAIADRLAVSVLPMATTRDVGTLDAVVAAHDLNDPAVARDAVEVLATIDEAFLDSYIREDTVDAEDVAVAIANHTRDLNLCPVFFGAALTGSGIEPLLNSIVRLLPAATGVPTGEASGTVFKIERDGGGKKVALVRMFGGTVETRDRLSFEPDSIPDTVTDIEVFEHGRTQRRRSTSAGEIARVSGLVSARVGATFGPDRSSVDRVAFAAPSLETAIVPKIAGEKQLVFGALSELAEQDPLINLRQDDARGELFLSLYGEVQKEVVAETLASEYGLEIEFRPTTAVCVERPNRVGAAIEEIREGRSPNHPFLATVGLRIGPLPVGSGVVFELDVGVKTIPIHVFDSVDVFRDLMRRTVVSALKEGINGWEVTDCKVTMTECDYQAPPRRWPGTTLSDYRDLTPLVLMSALLTATTTVCEPVVWFRLEFPSDVLGAMMSLLASVGAQPQQPSTDRSICVIEGECRAARSAVEVARHDSWRGSAGVELLRLPPSHR